MILNPWRVSFWDIITTTTTTTTTTTSRVWQKPLSGLPETQLSLANPTKGLQILAAKINLCFSSWDPWRKPETSCQHFLGPFFFIPTHKHTRLVAPNKSWRS
jgi:hypothetical protein